MLIADKANYGSGHRNEMFRMNVPECNNALSKAVEHTMQQCQIDINLDSLEVRSLLLLNPLSVQSRVQFTQNLCENEACYNGALHFESEIKRACPVDYVAEIPFKEKTILANATAWLTPIRKETLAVLPVCTKDLNDQVRAVSRYFCLILSVLHA